MGCYLVGWLLVFVLGGCAVPAKPPVEPLPAVSAQELLHGLELRAGRFEALQGLGRIRVTVAGRTQSARQVLLVTRPDRLRAEVLGPLGQTVLTVAAGEGILTAFLPGEKRFLTGAATPDNLQRLIRVPLAPAELVRLMLHDVPLADASAARGEVREDRYRLVLPTAGGAEAFTLIARALTPAHPMVVHPQFTEPEAALRAAGAAVQRWLLPVADDRPLANLPGWADAVFVGNPTNPTGRLHRRDDLLAAAGDRLLVVDEAFMDATDEAESLIGTAMPGRLVLRSLSKTWGLAGLRVGYVVGDPALIARLEAGQPPWSVSSPALAAMIATSTERAIAEARRRYADLAVRRERFAARLAAAGFPSLPSAAPFLLVNTSACGADSVRPALATAGFAVRRGESFPGLSAQWIRVRVPEPAQADRLVAALEAVALETARAEPVSEPTPHECAPRPARARHQP